MTDEQIATFRKRLEDERAQLETDIAGEEITDLDLSDSAGVGNHVADDASDVFERERNLALRGNAEDIVAQIDGALRHIDAGTYGVCERCGREIPVERLDAKPYAAYDIECQEIVERAREPFGSTNRV